MFKMLGTQCDDKYLKYSRVNVTKVWITCIFVRVYIFIYMYDFFSYETKGFENDLDT